LAGIEPTPARPNGAGYARLNFNKTMKNRMMKYMKLKNTSNWSKIMSPVLDAYNNSPHSTTKIAPNKVNKDNEIQVSMNINKEQKKEHIQN
jgi:hypothetical protein